MSKWNGKLKCIKDLRTCGLILTKDKVYEIKNRALTYDDGFNGFKYESFRDFKKENPSIGSHLIELKEIDMPNKTIAKEPLKETDWNIEQSKLAKYIMINDTITIAIPIDTPMGISFRHPDDEYNEEIGQALALKRMLE